jgi:hypothetical protein
MVRVSRPFRGLRSNCAGVFAEADPWQAWPLAAGAERDPAAVLKKDALFSGRQADGLRGEPLFEEAAFRPMLGA